VSFPLKVLDWLAALVVVAALVVGLDSSASDVGTRFIINSTANNTGKFATDFHDPNVLFGLGYNGQITGSIEGLQTFDSVIPGLFPEGSPEAAWICKRAADLDNTIRKVHKAGLKCYAATDLLVLPKALVKKLHSEICDEKDRIDVGRPKTQELLRAMFRETFQRFPDLDGVVVRTGEVYLHDFPYHTATGGTSGTQNLRQGNTAILHGPQSHIDILTILRDEVCVKQNKTLFYRTWDFGPKGFHENPEFYLKVTQAIEPHPNLFFSIKHQKGDFHQLTPFNPTLMIGRHRQIVEVQSQREAYGKGAHPYYIGKGVIEDWEEYDWLMKPGQRKGLRDLIHDPLFAGVWTWSGGGGWEGPYITNDFWNELNTYVVSQYVRNPDRDESSVFAEFAKAKGLNDDDAALFRKLCLLSTQAVLRGQLTCLPAKIDVWWARDHFLGAPDLKDFLDKGLMEKALAEKAEAVRMWKEIEALSQRIQFPDASLNDFVATSATYGRIKYAIIEQGWTILMLGAEGDVSGTYDTDRLSVAIARYDSLWKEWRELKETRPSCSSLYKDVGFDNKPGLGAAVERYRNVVTAAAMHGRAS